MKPSPELALAALPASVRALVLRVLAAAERGHVPVYLVGGPVRDLLLARPLRDVDLLVASPAGAPAALELAREAAGAGDVVTAHARFGTVHVQSGAARLDLANARRERYAHAGALPEVQPGSLAEDLARRDFSLNALALPLTRAAGSGLVDLADGAADLVRRELRVQHERSFHDDPTRALRAARFAARLDCKLAPESRRALRSALRDGAFGAVSGERLRAELEKLFAEPAPARALSLLAQWHVLSALEPGLGAPAGCLAALKRLPALAELAPDAKRWLVGSMLWLGGLEAALARRALRRFAITGGAAQRVAAFARVATRLTRRLSASRGRGLTDAILSEEPAEEGVALAAQAPATLRRRIERYLVDDRAAASLVSGQDLIALGMSGPAVGEALARIRIATLDHVVTRREEALELARELARKPPPATKRGGRVKH